MIIRGNIHIVEVDDFTRVCYPDKAETGGISPCIGLGILNRKNRMGYLKHAYPYVYEKKVGDFELFLDQAIIEAEDINDLEIALAGNIPLPEEEFENASNFQRQLEAHRHYNRLLINMIKAKGIKNKNIQNHLAEKPNPDYSYVMCVDTEEAKIEVKLEHDKE